MLIINKFYKREFLKKDKTDKEDNFKKKKMFPIKTIIKNS